MQRLLAAIKTNFEANGTLTGAFTGGIHFMEAAPGTALPYLIVVPVTSPTTYKYGGAAFSEPVIQFTSRAVGANTALANLETLMGVFDEIVFSLADSKQHFYTKRQGEPLPEPADPEQDEQGRDTFGWIITYDLATTG
jgi:hypothetical protein